MISEVPQQTVLDSLLIILYVKDIGEDKFNAIQLSASNWLIHIAHK